MSIPKSLHDFLTPNPKLIHPPSSVLRPHTHTHTHTHSPPNQVAQFKQHCRVHGPQSALHGPPSDLCRKTRDFSVSRQHSSSCAQPSCCTIITTCDRYGRPPSLAFSPSKFPLCSEISTLFHLFFAFISPGKEEEKNSLLSPRGSPS